jgi:hypothetical protein
MLTQESTLASAMPKKEVIWDIGGPKVPPTKLASWLLSAAIPVLLLLTTIAIVLIMAFRSTGIENAKANLPATIKLPSYSLAEMPVKPGRNLEDDMMQARLTHAFVPGNEVVHYHVRLRSGYHPKRKWSSDPAAKMKSPSSNFAEGTLEAIEYEQAMRQYLHDQAEYQRQLALWRQNRMIQ